MPGTGLSDGHPHLRNSSREPSSGPGLKELSSVWGTRRPWYKRLEDRAEPPSSGVSASFLQRARGKRQRPGDSPALELPASPAGWALPVPQRDSWARGSCVPRLEMEGGGLGKQVSDFADVGLKRHFPLHGTRLRQLQCELISHLWAMLWQIT